MISSSFDKFGRLLSKFERMGKDDIQETETAAPPGFDSNPIKDMIAIHAPTGVSGESVVIGFINKDCITDVGESRMFSTDENGELKMWLHLKNNGTAEFGGDVDNMVRYSELKTGYDKTKAALDAILTILNGAPIPEPGNGAPSALQTALAAALVGKNTGDISGAKIDEIKTL
jgi:hypothetical protein